jgi:hypothetical protein
MTQAAGECEVRFGFGLRLFAGLLGKKAKGRQMNMDHVPVTCTECGEEQSFFYRDAKGNANLVLKCSRCGVDYLAFNALRTAIYERMKEVGHATLKPPTPLPIDPVTVLPGGEGFEVVIRRNKKGGERTYTRRTKRQRTM